MHTFIIKVDMTKFKRSYLEPYGDLGKPRTLHDILIFNTEYSKEDVLSVKGVVSVEDDFQATRDVIEEPKYHVQTDAKNWFLGWLSQSSPHYIYERTGKDVDIFIVDTGVRLTHEDLPNAVSFWSYNGNEYDYSENHGTMCASCAGGKHYGIAKDATIQNAHSGMNFSNIAKAMDMILEHHLKSDRSTIVSMSFGAIANPLRDVWPKMKDAGIFLVSSAGNSGGDRPLWPARDENIISVGALDRDGDGASFTNGGADIYAPGVDGTVADTVSDTAITQFSGTSASCPLFAGIISLALERVPKITNRSDCDLVINTLMDEMRGTHYKRATTWTDISYP